MDLPTTKRRSARQLAGRKRSVYYELDSDEEDVQLLSGGEADVAAVSNPTPPPPSPPQRSSKRARKSQQPATRSQKRKQRSGAQPRKWEKRWRRPLGAIPKKKSANKTATSTIPSDDVKPAWTSLPLEILRDIFIYASQDLHDQTVVGSSIVTWLMTTARKVPGIAVPALEAYYLSPAMHSVAHPHHLLELLRLPPDETYLKYRYKVKRLEINVKYLAYSAQGKALLSMSDLVRELPHLQQLEIMHPMDEPPYRPLKFQKWYYPPDLFDTLDSAGTRLRTWRWSRDMISEIVPESMYRDMQQAHKRSCFERLDRLLVCGFDYNDSSEPAASRETDANNQPANLTSAIACLPELRDLTFISCDIVMEDFLLRLPKNLERLELTNCLEVTADMLQAYLTASGSDLRELVLNSNAALSLSFLPCLKTACPRLEKLVMDTTYYSERTNYNDAYAFYDQLLTASEIPTWPSTLRHLEFSNLQKWSSDAASTLFQSLVDAAHELPDLRRLIIQAHIDIAWRDRADFRDNWVDKLRATFFHRTAPPLPYLCSKKRYREWKEEQPLAEKPSNSGDPAEATSRRLSHVRITPRKRPADHVAFSDSDEEADVKSEAPLNPRRSARVAESLSAASLSATPAPETPDADADASREDGSGMFVQGLCEIVDVRIDNQRPRETQYTEANFLDSEVSGDEDWQSGNELDEDDGYAW